MSDSATPKKPEYNRQEGGRFGPGNNANPNGRPYLGGSLTELMRQYLEQVPEGEKIPRKQTLIAKVYAKAIQEDDKGALRLLWNYIDGMPPQKIDSTTDSRVVVSFDSSLDAGHSHLPAPREPEEDTQL